MALCSPLSEAAANAVEVENVDKVAGVAVVTWTAGQNVATSNGEGRLLSLDAADDSLDEGGSDDENSQTYYFRSSTIIVSKIKEMVEKGYFADGKACALRAETVLEPESEEAIVYEDFFLVGLRMPLHLALADILLKFQAQLHQLIPITIAQLSKYFWVVGSFTGVPEGNALAKRYKLHYQPKKVETPEGEMFAQYGCLNFHAKRDGGPKLSLTIKNKWSAELTKSWFYCRVPCLRSFEGGKSVYALHSRMSLLDYTVKPEVECPNDDANNAAFVQATTTIGGQDAIEEFVACKMYPLASSFGFKGVTIGTISMSKV
jgi:hypothetical protein